MAALSAVQGTDIEFACDALAEVLKHERRFWNRQIRDIVEKERVEDLADALPTAVAALTLVGGAKDR